MRFYSEAQALERCRYWQQVLRLQDWDIAVAILRRKEMTRGVGRTSVSLFRRAQIDLLHYDDTADVDFSPDRDQEITLVHELLHLQFEEAGHAPLKDESTAEYRAFERAIEHTAVALVTLERAKAPATEVQR